MQTIIEINPNECTKWKYADRSEFEFGDISQLAKDIKINGQLVPVFARHIKHPQSPNIKYEILAGARRWKACREAEIPLKAIILDVDDEQAAIIQIKENERMDICDYSKGMYYAQLLKDKKMTQLSIAQSTGISNSKIGNFFTFSKIPQEIWDAVKNMSRISSSASATIYTLSKKGDEYVQALIEIAEEIRKGAGCRRIENLVLKIVSQKNPAIKKEQDKNRLISQSGKIIATWKNANLKFESAEIIDKEAINQAIIESFNKKEKNV